MKEVSWQKVGGEHEDMISSIVVALVWFCYRTALYETRERKVRSRAVEEESEGTKKARLSVSGVTLQIVIWLRA